MTRRYLKPNAATYIPRRLVFLDTETIRENIDGQPLRFQHYLRCGVARSCRIEKGKITRRHTLHFDEQRQFWDWLDCVIDRYCSTWIVCHKSSFDMGIIGLWEQLDCGRFVLDAPRGKRPIGDEGDADNRLQRGLCVLDDPPFILGLCSRNGSRLIVVDTLNWFRMSLKELGDSIGLPKLEMPTDSALASDWKTYCERDVEIVERAFLSLIDFANLHDVGMFRYTAPSQSMSMYRHKHMHHKIELHDDVYVKQLERKSYYGGEVRCFWIGKIKQPIYQLDVNGLYPFVMRQCTFPRKLSYCPLGQQQTLNLAKGLESVAIATVEINTTKRVYPLRTKEGLAYVRGRFITTLAGPELAFAAQMGDIVKVTQAAYYDLAPLFADYVNDLYELRLQYQEQHNPAFALLCKLFLNSLYGKFGQRSFKWEQLVGKIPHKRWARWIEMNIDTKAIEIHRSIGPYEFVSREPGEHRDSFPAVAAFVTSWGRQYMRYLRSVIGESHCYYQATDSLIVDADGLLVAACEGLLHDQELGALKIVAEGESGEIRGPNHYKIGEKSIRSGLRRNARQITPEKWYQEIFEKCEGQVAREPNNTVQSWQTIFRDRQSVYRPYCGEMGRVEPLTLVGPTSSTHGVSGST